MIEELLDISGSNVLPINTHNLTPERAEQGLEIGFGGVTYKALSAKRNLASMHRVLNINHHTTSEGAFEKTKLAFSLTGERVIKLEVLSSDLKTSNDAEIIEAVRKLRGWNNELIILPLLSSDIDTARILVDLGCPLLRVMGSAIGSCQGIANAPAFKQICELGVPVVLDGGVGSAKDFHQALMLGASGVLINSMLFSSTSSPGEVMASFIADYKKSFLVQRA